MSLSSGIGSYGGQGWIGQPWDSILVAVVSLGIYWWAVRSGAEHIEATAEADVGDSAAVSDALSAVAVAQLLWADADSSGSGPPNG